MMKSKYDIYIFLTLCTSLVAGSCADEAFIDNGTYSDSGNTIRFDVSSGFGNTAAVSRSGGYGTDDSDGLDPVLLSEGSDTLYLHRYVALETERATGHNAAAISRSTPVNSTADFRTINGESGFRVKAMFTAGNKEYFPFSTAVPLASETSESPDDDVWHIIDPVRYWPDGRELCFYAYAPASAENLFQNLKLNGNNITFDYTVPVSTKTPRCDAENQPDIMLATTMYSHTMGANHSDLAPLNFRHALSAIKFAVRDVTDGEIVDISIKGVSGSGSCSFTTGSGFTWTNLGETTDYVQAFNYKTEDSYSENIPVVNIKIPEKTFMLVPQKIPEDAVLEITFKTKGGVNKTLRGKLKTSDISQWKAGEEYIYTISTSSENWTYIFEVYGNHNSKNGVHGASTDADILKGNQIYVYCPMNVAHEKYGDNAYFGVRSYRYRTNNPNKQEVLPWRASHPSTKQYRVRANDEEEYTDVAYKNSLDADVWILKSSPLKGSGSSDMTGEIISLQFAEHSVVSDWPGDVWMQLQDSYKDNSKQSPWDLSTCGGNVKRSTANTYIIDRGGWYAIPLVYGNAITNGITNKNAYEYPENEDDYNIKNFVDHNNQPIGGPWITKKYNTNLKAGIVWTDAYGAIDTMSIGNVDGDSAIIFHAEKSNMQQGNVIIALYQGNTIVWSWQIWITEHWLDPKTGTPEALSDSSFPFEKNEKSGWRQRGDVKIDNKYCEGSKNYMISPYNLGWCDPKNVDYLRRREMMTFVQYETDGITKTKKSAQLPIIQDGGPQEYKYGNNTYYQWGRKDPSVGFVDHFQTLKQDFGPKQFTGISNTVSIGIGIQTPHIFYMKGDWDADWCDNQRINYWNNTVPQNPDDPDADNDINKYTHTVKTIYDPCPAGYVVPPSYVMRFIGKSDMKHPDDNVDGPSFKNSGSDNTTYNNLNGYPNADWYTVMISSKNYDKDTTEDKDLIWLASTGNRFRNNYELNFNPQIIYAWTSTGSTWLSDVGNVNNGSFGPGMAYGLALGKDAGTSLYVVCAYFIGAKGMGRPIRPIRENSLM